MKGSLKITLLTSLTIIIIIIGILCVKNNKLDEKDNTDDFINISELSPKFMEDYFNDYQKLQEQDNKENILIISSKTKLKQTYGATEIVEAPNNQYILQYDNEEEKNTALESFNKEENIIAEENLTRQLANVTTESFNSWGIEKMGLNRASAFVNSNGGKDVVVAIIDTGLDTQLFNQEFPGKLAGTYNAFDNGVMRDTNGHGTHIAGTIAEGTPENVKIYSYKVSEGKDLYISDILESIYYIVDRENADVINMSFGSYSISTAEKNAILSANEKNIICIAAAGNENSTLAHYPSALDATISVASVDINLNKSTFSNYHSTVDFAAPGTSIMSINRDPAKVIMSGTSMATPHIVSAAAILKTFNKDLTLEDVKSVLRTKAVDLGAKGKDNIYGYGFVNFENTEFCDGIDCDMWNIYKSGSIKNITAPNTITPIYNYGNEMNLYNAEIRFYYNDSDYFTRKLANVEGAEITNYDPYNKTMQNVVITIDGNTTTLRVDNTSIKDGWIYEELRDNKIQLNAYYVDETQPLITVKIPETYDSYEVVSLGEELFFGNLSITSVELPNTIEKISDYAFYYCEYLRKVKLSENLITIGDRAFEANSITEIDFPSSLTSIGMGAFQGNDLKELSIPANIIDIGVTAFSENSKLEKIIIDSNNPVYDSRNNSNAIIETASDKLLVGTKNTIIPNDIKQLDDESFSYVRINTIDIPNTVTKIGKYAFSGSDITTIELPPQLTTIEQGLFYNSKIESIVIPSNVTKIQDMSFGYCYYLEQVTFNEKLQTIGKESFIETALKNIYIPKNVSSIGNYAFYRLYYLESLVIDAENKTYDSRDNSHAIIETSTNKLIAGFGPSKVPSSVTTIGREAFSGVVTEVNIPEGVTTIEDYAFSDCEYEALEKISLPKSLSNIGKIAFAYYNYDDGYWYFYRNLLIWVYENTYSKDYVITEKYDYFTKDPYKINVNLAKTKYEVYDTVDTTDLSIELQYNDQNPRTETIIDGYSIALEQLIHTSQYQEQTVLVKFLKKMLVLQLVKKFHYTQFLII